VETSAGHLHSLFLAENGDVYSCGEGCNGQLGHGNEKKRAIPKKIAALDGLVIKQISAGSHHSLVLSDRGELYGFGVGDSGVGSKDDVLAPKLVKFFRDKPIAKISAGGFHSLVLTKDDELYDFGRTYD